MKKKRTIVLIIILLLFPFVCEAVAANWNITFLHAGDKGVNNIDLQRDVEVLEENNEKGNVVKVFRFKDINQYVNKLKVSLRTEEVPDFDLKITYLNEYDYEEETTLGVRLLKEMTSSTVFIDKKVVSFDLITKDLGFSLQDASIQNVVSYNAYRFALFAMVSGLVGICVYLYDKNKFKLEYLFTIVAIMIGSLMIIMLPKVAHWGMDSEIHFKNAYINSFIGGGYDNSRSLDIAIELPTVTMPTTIEDTLAISEVINDEQSEKTTSSSVKNILPAYNELAYAPYSIGIMIGRILNLSFSMCFMLGKFINLLVYTALGFFTLKITTKGKRLFFALLLIPSMLYSVAQYSLDGLLYGCMMLSFALFFQQYFDKTKKLTFGWTMAFVIATCMAGFAKAVYCLVVLLPLLFSKDKFLNKKQMMFFKLSMCFICVLLLSAMVLPILTGSSGPSDLRGGLTSSSEQLKTLITHPIPFIQQYFMIWFNSLNNNLLAGGTFGLFGYIGMVNSSVIFIETLLILFLALTDWNITEKIKVKHKVVWFVMLSALVLMIHGAMHLSFTPVGQTSVNGVQPRYFIHILPLLFILVANPTIKHKFNDKKFNLITVAIVSSVCFISVYSLILSVFCN